jgi:SPRY domain
MARHHSIEYTFIVGCSSSMCTDRQADVCMHTRANCWYAALPIHSFICSPLYLFPQAGDVVGCMLDIAAGTISYTLNGVHMGTAFQLQAHEQPQQKGKGKRKANAEAVDTAVGTTVDTTVSAAAAYFPALSLEQGESVVINAGT